MSINSFVVLFASTFTIFLIGIMALGLIITMWGIKMKDMIPMEYVELSVYMVFGVMTSFCIAWIICTLY